MRTVGGSKIMMMQEDSLSRTAELQRYVDKARMEARTRQRFWDSEEWKEQVKKALVDEGIDGFFREDD